MKINDKITDDIKQWCSCTIVIGLSYDTMLKCLPRNKDLIIFETKVYASNDTIALLEQSIREVLYNSSSNTVIVKDNALELTNKICLDKPKSNAACIIEEEMPARNRTAKSNSTGTTIGVVIAVLVIVLLAIVAAVIIMVIYYKRRRTYQ